MSKDLVLTVYIRRRLLVTFIAINILVFSGLVQSHTIVFSQLPLNGGNGAASFYEEHSADDFILTKNSLIGKVYWWGSYTDEVESDNVFNISFFEDNIGVPGNLISENLSLTATRKITGFTDIVGNDVFQFSASVSYVLLQKDIKYYVSFVHPSNGIDDEFFWLLSDNSGNNFTRNVNATNDRWWEGVSSPGNLAFQLTSVPVPPALLMFASGLLALISSRKKSEN